MCSVVLTLQTNTNNEFVYFENLSCYKIKFLIKQEDLATITYF